MKEMHIRTDRTLFDYIVSSLFETTALSHPSSPLASSPIAFSHTMDMLGGTLLPCHSLPLDMLDGTLLPCHSLPPGHVGWNSPPLSFSPTGHVGWNSPPLSFSHAWTCWVELSSLVILSHLDMLDGTLLPCHSLPPWTCWMELSSLVILSHHGHVGWNSPPLSFSHTMDMLGGTLLPCHSLTLDMLDGTLLLCRSCTL